MNLEPVIGLEVHVQLKTNTKVFCSCANEFGVKENTHICPVCLGLPGSLPVLNEKVLKSGAKVALAVSATVRDSIKFDRKNYFYPDLPKNFQISQYDMPLAERGFLDIEVNGSLKRIRIKRVHLEEDAGKLIHPEAKEESLVDFNRAGTPLLEIVSEPDINSPDEAYQYLTDLKLILQYLEVSDCDMEKGSLRCDANVSLRPVGSKGLGVKAELKNMNSFKAVRLGLEYEIKRQTKCLEAGEKITQETRLWNEKTGQTSSMRSKEEAHDYRYFPEPDLPPFVLTETDIENIRVALPELPKERSKRFVQVFNLTEKEAAVLISDKEVADFFEKCLSFLNEPKKIVHWISGSVLFEMNSRHVSFKELNLVPEHFIELIKKVEDDTVSQLMAKSIFTVMLASGSTANDIINEKKLAQVSNVDELRGVIEDVIAKNAKTVQDYKAGKENALMFLLGQVMKASGGKANPKIAKELIAERLKT